MISLLAALILSQTATGEPCYRVPRAGHGCGMRATGRSGSSGQPLCSVLLAADKAGAWECMKGDGTMLSGSATTFVATGTPTNTTEAGQLVRTYTSAQNDQQPANAAFPASDFTVCTHHRSVANVTALLMAFGTSGAAAGFSAIAVQNVTTGTFFLDVSNGATDTTFANTSATTAGSWYLECMVYTRTGGAANNVLTAYINGVASTSVSNAALAQALSSVWSTNGYAAAAVGQASSVRGFFVTYKALSATDIARIYAAVGQ